MRSYLANLPFLVVSSALCSVLLWVLQCRWWSLEVLLCSHLCAHLQFQLRPTDQLLLWALLLFLRSPWVNSEVSSLFPLPTVCSALKWSENDEPGEKHSSEAARRREPAELKTRQRKYPEIQECSLLEAKQTFVCLKLLPSVPQLCSEPPQWFIALFWCKWKPEPFLQMTIPIAAGSHYWMLPTCHHK